MIRLRLNPTVRKNLILDAAWQAFLQAGSISGATRETIARLANCSTGAVSRYFSSADLARLLLSRARKEKRWTLLREALPGGTHDGAIRLSSEERKAIVNATIVKL